jgi:hypothetical protein
MQVLVLKMDPMRNVRFLYKERLRTVSLYFASLVAKEDIVILSNKGHNSLWYFCPNISTISTLVTIIVQLFVLNGLKNCCF